MRRPCAAATPTAGPNPYHLWRGRHNSTVWQTDLLIADGVLWLHNVRVNPNEKYVHGYDWTNAQAHLTPSLADRIYPTPCALPRCRSPPRTWAACATRSRARGRRACSCPRPRCSAFVLACAMARPVLAVHTGAPSVPLLQIVNSGGAGGLSSAPWPQFNPTCCHSSQAADAPQRARIIS